MSLLNRKYLFFRTNVVKQQPSPTKYVKITIPEKKPKEEQSSPDRSAELDRESVPFQTDSL